MNQFCVELCECFRHNKQTAPITDFSSSKHWPSSANHDHYPAGPINANRRSIQRNQSTLKQIPPQNENRIAKTNYQLESSINSTQTKSSRFRRSVLIIFQLISMLCELMNKRVWHWNLYKRVQFRRFGTLVEITKQLIQLENDHGFHNQLQIDILMHLNFVSLFFWFYIGFK